MSNLPLFRDSDESGEAQFNIGCLVRARRLLTALREQPESRPHLLVAAGSGVPQMPTVADMQAAAATLQQAVNCLAYQYEHRSRDVDCPLGRDTFGESNPMEQDNDTPF